MKRIFIAGCVCLAYLALLSSCTTKKEAEEQQQEQEVEQQEQTDNQENPDQAGETQQTDGSGLSSDTQAMIRDMQREDDLNYVSWRIRDYYIQNNRTYPDVTYYGELEEELEDYLDGEALPTDPVADMNYRYNVSDDLSFYILGAWREWYSEYLVVTDASPPQGAEGRDFYDQMVEEIRGESPFEYEEHEYQESSEPDYELSDETLGSLRDSQNKSDLANVKTSLEMYYQDNSFRYPVVDSFEELEDELWLYFETGPFPLDDSYYYKADEDGSSYEMWAILSDGTEWRVYSAQ